MPIAPRRVSSSSSSSVRISPGFHGPVLHATRTATSWPSGSTASENRAPQQRRGQPVADREGKADLAVEILIRAELVPNRLAGPNRLSGVVRARRKRERPGRGVRRPGHPVRDMGGMDDLHDPGEGDRQERYRDRNLDRDRTAPVSQERTKHAHAHGGFNRRPGTRAVR